MSKEEIHGMDTLFGDLEPEVNPGWEYVLKLLADKDIAKYICDAKGFYHSGIQLAGNIWDASLMGYLLNPASNKYTMPELMHSYDAGVQEPEEAWTDSMKLGWQCYGLAQIGERLQKKLMLFDLLPLYQDRR